MSSWEELSLSFQRSSIVVIFALLDWVFRGFYGLSFILQICQYLFLFAFTYKLNQIEVDAGNDECVEVDSFLTQIITSGYFFFFGYYLGAALALLALVIAFSAFRLYSRYEAWNKREKSKNIRIEEFKNLRSLKE